MGTIRFVIKFLTRHHFFGSLAIVVLASTVMAIRIADRFHFASSELHKDVSERWGAPIEQPVPSVRFVESGSVFNRLESLPLAKQTIRLDADMSYRKRGLVYFSGFAFTFNGAYRIHNDQGKTIDLVFVFPLQMIKDRVLLSDLSFRVDGEPAEAELGEDRRRLQWTGRLADGEALDIDIQLRGRGLDSFTYRLDPELPVQDFSFDMHIRGGDGFDYRAGVLPATEVTEQDDETVLSWSYDSLESGVAVGAVLPSVKAFDDIILQMIRHGLVAFLIFFISTAALFERFEVRPRIYQGYALAAGWAFFYVLLPYLAAFVHFYLAYVISLTIIFALLHRFLVGLAGAAARRPAAVVLTCSLVVPTFAVVMRGFTGLIYTLELLVMLGVLLHQMIRPEVVEAIDDVLYPPEALELAGLDLAKVDLAKVEESHV